MGGRLPTLFPTDYCPSKVVDFNQSFSQEINIRGRPMIIFVKSSPVVLFFSPYFGTKIQTFKNFLENFLRISFSLAMLRRSATHNDGTLVPID